VRAVETIRVLPGQRFRGERIGVLALSDGFFGTQGYPRGWYREGDPTLAAAAIREGRGVNVSDALSDRFALHLNDVIDLDTPTGRVSLPVVGIVPDFISDRGSVILGRRLLAERWGEDTATRLNVFIESTAALAEVRRQIDSALGDRYPLKILTLGAVLEYHDAYRRQALAFTDTIQLLIVVVTVAGVLDLLLSAIIERRRQFAVWRLIGAAERVVQRSVVIEAATVGALGALLSALVGAVTAWIWVRFNFRHLLGYYLEFSFPVGATLWYLLLAVGVAALTGRLASRCATRAPILDGLRID
jgi:putative ABC transport system permease protein